MAKSKAFAPNLSAQQQSMAEQLGIPEEFASKKVGQLKLKQFGQCVERGVELQESYEEQQAQFKLQDKRIARQVARASHAEDHAFQNELALLDIELDSELDDETRVLRGIKTSDELLEQAQQKDELQALKDKQEALKESIAKMEQQRKELSSAIASDIASGKGKGKGNGKGQQVGPVVAS
jgi:hypothetical protein